MKFTRIKNVEELLSHGDVNSRKLVLEITDEVLNRLDSYHRLRSFISRKDSMLNIGERVLNLDDYKRIYVFCAGKASNNMAHAFEDILGNRLTQGVVIVKIKEPTDVYQRTELYVGGHPLPNAGGVEGSKRVLSIADQMEADDLFIVGLSGGCTALMGYPVEGITLEEMQAATDVMIKSGMWVMDINDVRGHLCRMNRGRLGQRITKGTQIECFEIWDAVGLDEMEDYTKPIPIMGTPVGYDPVTFEDIIKILKEHDLMDKLPQNVVDYFVNATPEQETPKAAGNVTYYVINTLPDACKCAMEVAEERGIPAVVLTTYAEGESKDYGAFTASLAKEMLKNGRPFKRPCLIFSGGETTTYIPDNLVIKGHGGPSQELAAGFALVAKDAPGACMLSIDTEGTDGTTIMAGGLTDSKTYDRSLAAGINLRQVLKEHSSNEALSALGDCIYTGNTGTNLCDFNVLYVPGDSEQTQ
jgi:glycerate 2-kinase